MKELIKQINKNIIDKNFHINLEGYSKEEVDSFMEQISTMLLIVAEKNDQKDQLISELEQYIVNYKKELDQLKLENARLEASVEKLKEARNTNAR
ncbi:hypothetical protein GE118_00720 [Mycoplasma sp. NEAQ87857]|uniref:DivIVA domain-containing protein n=1 Tax=Mycoplasma sp. NEAQ87857 TaxID=2683967 RepID=UPI0013171374|nr:DivIVA domain-containing protein [Mycoplasma sp. NEAQ87857]QGZ97324.1 hypothetical protein GE118_00720 [Mycoplasma sp. NEAQ87857]